MTDVKLVAEREIGEKLRSRGFVIFTLLSAILLPGAVFVTGMLGGGQASQQEVVVAGQDARQVRGVIEQQAAQRSGLAVEVRSVSGEQAARSAVRGGDAEVALVGSRAFTQDGAAREMRALLQGSVQRLQLSRTLQEAGLPPEQARAELAAPQLTFEALDSQSGQGGKGLAVIFIGVLLLFVGLIMYGSWIAMGVVEEKSSRVVELVIATIRPVRLLAGKVLGIGALAIGQLLLSVALAIGVAVVMDVGLPPVTFTAAGSVLLWFVLGFALYCCLFAIAGSLVSKQEDLQYTQFPAMLPIMVAYFVAIQAQAGALSDALVHGLAYVPLFSPILVPMLTGSGQFAAWEVAVAAVLTVLAAMLLMWVAARIYRGSVLRFGGRVSLREAWR